MWKVSSRTHVVGITVIKEYNEQEQLYRVSLDPDLLLTYDVNPTEALNRFCDKLEAAAKAVRRV